MAVCSYLVTTGAGRVRGVAKALAALPGCEVVMAENRDLLLLVTDTAGPDEERALHARLGQVPGIRSVVLTFGQLVPEAGPPAFSGDLGSSA
jgi:nitrate reductase NapAB chaperone NapD